MAPQLAQPTIHKPSSISLTVGAVAQKRARSKTCVHSSLWLHVDHTCCAWLTGFDRGKHVALTRQCAPTPSKINASPKWH
jgi:hypothetical protein